MNMLKGYYAYLAIAGGVLLRLVMQSNWMLQIVALALISVGAWTLVFSREHCSRCVHRAAADLCSGSDPAGAAAHRVGIRIACARIADRLPAADGLYGADARRGTRHSI